LNVEKEKELVEGVEIKKMLIYLTSKIGVGL
jgi:hypothetical protein